MLRADLEAIIDKDYPVLSDVTESTLDVIDRHRQRFRGSVRISTGRVYTTEGFRVRKERVEKLQLP